MDHSYPIVPQTDLAICLRFVGQMDVQVHEIQFSSPWAVHYVRFPKQPGFVRCCELPRYRVSSIFTQACPPSVDDELSRCDDISYQDVLRVRFC